MNHHIEKDEYSYSLSTVPNHGKRTVNITITGGKLKGKSALIIKMPDAFSGFFPKLASEDCSQDNMSLVGKTGIALKGANGRS